MANTSTIHIKTDFDCKVYDYGQEIGTTKADTFFKVELRKGEHELTFVYTQNESITKSILYIVEDADCDYRLNVDMTETIYRKAKEYEELFYETEEFAVEAFGLYQKAAEKGHVEAQYELGEIYMDGAILDYIIHGRLINPNRVEELIKAVEWYTKAANQGCAPAQYKLGECYYFGNGVKKDYKKAVVWYTKAAQQGHIDAQYSLGYCYYHNQGVEEDPDKAFELFAKAAEKGHADAQYNLGNCYYCGEGVEEDMHKAIEWLAKAAEQGHADAQHNLGNCYYFGDGVEKDIVEAVKWYKKAAEQGVILAQRDLGLLYENGDGVRKDHNKAIEWFAKAASNNETAQCFCDAENGDADSQCDLGDCYMSGQGMDGLWFKKDDAIAVKWYTKAAKQGHAKAQFALGNCYEEGKGVEEDYLKAIKWYTKAANQGNVNAQKNLIDCYYKLGECYEFGYGFEKKPDMAEKWYSKAAEEGHKDAQNAVLRLLLSKTDSIVATMRTQMFFPNTTKNSKPQTKPIKYLFFDTETTGIPKDYDAPTCDSNNWPRLVQLSWITTDEDYNVLSKNDHIIYPKGFTIPEDAARVHGITTKTAKEKGEPLNEVIEKFHKDYDAAYIIVGHNIDFDKKIISAELFRLEEMDFILFNTKLTLCTMEASTDYCKIPGYHGYKYPKLQELHKKLFGYEFEDAHNSMSDVTATLKCFKEMRKRGLI